MAWSKYKTSQYIASPHFSQFQSIDAVAKDAIDLISLRVSVTESCANSLVAGRGLMQDKGSWDRHPDTYSKNASVISSMIPVKRLEAN